MNFPIEATAVQFGVQKEISDSFFVDFGAGNFEKNENGKYYRCEIACPLWWDRLYVEGGYGTPFPWDIRYVIFE